MKFSLPLTIPTTPVHPYHIQPQLARGGGEGDQVTTILPIEVEGCGYPEPLWTEEDTSENLSFPRTMCVRVKLGKISNDQLGLFAQSPAVRSLRFAILRSSRDIFLTSSVK